MKKLLTKLRPKALFLFFPMFFFVSLQLLAQQTIAVTGKVTDADGEPLPGATVVVKGTSTGIVTDMDGNYSIDVTQGQLLNFSFIGYIDKEVAVTNQTEINIILELNVTALEEAVVVGYGYMRKVDITGAVGIVENETV